MANTVTIEFVKHPVAFKLAYFPGDVVSMESKQAKELIAAGVAVISEGQSDLPKDIPGRTLLLKAKLTLKEVKEITDLTQIEGISKTTAQKIVKYLNT